MRADLVVARTAVAHAAWRGAMTVAEQDIRVAAELALPHRRRRDPFDDPGIDRDQLDEALAQAGAESAGDPERDPDPSGRRSGCERAWPATKFTLCRESCTGNAKRAAGESLPHPCAVGARCWRGRTGAPVAGPQRIRQRGRRPPTRGRRPRHAPVRHPACPPPRRRRQPAGCARNRTMSAGPIREGREGNLVIFVVDASGSMAARDRMAAVSGATLSLLRDAYQRRDKVAVITFRQHEARLLLPPTSSAHIASRRLNRFDTGGKTPLAEGLLAARELIIRERRATRPVAAWSWCSPTAGPPPDGPAGPQPDRRRAAGRRRRGRGSRGLRDLVRTTGFGRAAGSAISARRRCGWRTCTPTHLTTPCARPRQIARAR